MLHLDRVRVAGRDDNAAPASERVKERGDRGFEAAVRGRSAGEPGGDLSGQLALGPVLFVGQVGAGLLGLGQAGVAFERVMQISTSGKAYFKQLSEDASHYLAPNFRFRRSVR